MTDVICDMPRDDRPRERLFAHGAQTLSNSELVAILLGCGRRGKNAIQVARELLANGLRSVRWDDPLQLASISGIGPAKAARLAVVWELQRRMNSDEPEEPPPFDAHAFGTQLVRTMANHPQERLGAVLLDARHRILKQKEVFVGTIKSALVSTGDIIRFVLLERGGAAVVVYHNHPSGSPAPSEEDESFTTKLKHSLSLADIELVDHLITGTHSYVSMRERGLI